MLTSKLAHKVNSCCSTSNIVLNNPSLDMHACMISNHKKQYRITSIIQLIGNRCPYCVCLCLCLWCKHTEEIARADYATLERSREGSDAQHMHTHIHEQTNNQHGVYNFFRFPPIEGGRRADHRIVHAHDNRMISAECTKCMIKSDS